uniref:Uncharacterized protein n=1 Tax=Trichuris muris TaxID=70415 RepID=A0A5S6QP10_TRIMR
MVSRAGEQPPTQAVASDKKQRSIPNETSGDRDSPEHTGRAAGYANCLFQIFKPLSEREVTPAALAAINMKLPQRDYCGARVIGYQCFYPAAPIGRRQTKRSRLSVKTPAKCALILGTPIAARDDYGESGKLGCFGSRLTLTQRLHVPPTQDDSPQRLKRLPMALKSKSAFAHAFPYLWRDGNLVYSFILKHRRQRRLPSAGALTHRQPCRRI